MKSEQCHWISVVWKNEELKIWEEELSASVNWQQEHKFVVFAQTAGLALEMATANFSLSETTMQLNVVENKLNITLERKL